MTARVRAVRVAGVLLLCSGVLSAPSARAQGEPLGVVLRTSEAADATLLERVEGQLVDLPVRLRTLPLADVSDSLEGAVAQARAIAMAHDARVVVWFSGGEELVAHVAEPAAQRVLIRELGPVAQGPARSAQLEAAALVVRTAVRAIASGGEIGVDEREAVATAASGPSVETGSSSPSADSPPAPEAPRPTSGASRASPPRRARLWLSAGWRAVADGVGPRGAQAGQAALGWAFDRRAALGLRGSFGLPAELRQSDVDLTLARHTASLWLSRTLLQRRRVALELAGAVGVALFHTSTTPRSEAFEAEPDGTTPVPLVSLDVRLSHFPAFAGGFVGWAITLGADGLPMRPQLVVEQGNQRRVRESLYPLSPRAALSLVVRGARR